MSHDNDARNVPYAETEYEAPAVTEVGDAGKVILGPDKEMLDVDNSTKLP